METKTRLNDYLKSILNKKECVDVLLSGNSLTNFVLEDEDELEKYNAFCEEFGYEVLEDDTVGLTVKEYHEKLAGVWLMPDEYKNMDMLAFLLTQCKTEEEKNRVQLEYEMFRERDLIIVLQLLKYIIDVFRKNNAVWGVGRGSSVASYCLYLIGVHKVNSLKYGLSITEFLK